MRPRAARLLLPLAAAALLALSAGTAQAQDKDCNPTWDCIQLIQRNDAQMEDTYIDEGQPLVNQDSGDGATSLVVRGGAGVRSWALLRFPLLEALPKNITINEAGFLLGYVGACDVRPLQFFELQQPFAEASVTWSTGRLLQRSQFAVHNSTEGGPLQGGFTFGNCLGQQRFFGNANTLNGVTASIQKYYERRAPYHGHLIKDEQDEATPAGFPATNEFASSNDANAPPPNSFQNDLRPGLRVRFNPNNPEIRNLLVDGRQYANATTSRPLNLSFEVFDRVGQVTNAWINVTHYDTGRELLNRSVFPNRTAQFLDVFRYRVWSLEPLNLTPGRYVMNAFALDNDGNLNYTRFDQINITVENIPPYVNQTRDAQGVPRPFLSATELDEGQELRVEVNATDADSGIGGVTLEITRGGEVLDNLTLRARQVDVNMSGDWNLTVRARWAGRLNATVWVRDTAGNLNRSEIFALRVRDVLPPVFLDARVVTPGRDADAAFQEEGGPVAWVVDVMDASPLNVTLRIEPPSGAALEVPMARQGLTTLYRHQATFAQQGSYGAVATARDLDGNTVSRGGLGFVMRQGQPPVIDQLRPAQDQFAAGDALVSAVITDLNLDASTILMEARVPPDPFAVVEATTVSLSETARRVEFRERFFHGERIEVRLRAADVLGRSAEFTWGFTVDDRFPTTFLTPQGLYLAGEVTAIASNTTLLLERSDQGSGLVATTLAVVNDDRGLEERNITITGTGPATLTLRASPVYTGTGNYSLFFGSVDRAGNVETVQHRRFLVDDTPPVVAVDFEPGLLTARVQERGTGLREVRATYWQAPGGTQGQSLMSPSADRTVWQAQIPDAERGTQVLYAVEATDLLGNVGRAGSAANPLSSIVQNHRPLVSITPANGSLVRGQVTIEWAATDKDGDPLQTSVSVRPSTSDDARELVPLRGAQGSVAWDTRAAGDGLWVVEVTARDGFEAVVARSLVDVSNTDSKIVALQVAPVEPNQPARIEATLYKPVRRAEAVVFLAGQEVARVQLRDDGGPPDRKLRDGVFTGAFTPTRSGDYRVDLDVLFDDGRLESRDGAAVAKVQYAFPAVIVHEPLLLVLVVGAPLVAAGYWVFRRYGPIRPKR